MTSRKFWGGKRVFLTGHTGFKGSWLSAWLKDLGADLTGFALPPPTKPSLFEVANVAPGMTSIIGDIRDPIALENALRNARPRPGSSSRSRSMVSAVVRCAGTETKSGVISPPAVSSS